MATETKRAKLRRFQTKRTQLRMELVKVATEREMYHKTNDGSLHHFYSMRNSKHKAHRSRLDGRKRSLVGQIERYDRKIKELEDQINN